MKRVRPAAVRSKATLPECRSTIDFTSHRPSPSPATSGSAPAPRREAREQRLALARGGSRPLILHPCEYLSRARLGADAHGAVLGRELVGVGEQVDKHLGETRLVARHQRQILGQAELEGLAPLRQERAHPGARLFHHLGECHALVADAELSRLDAYALEQVVDELCQTQRATLE